MADISGLNEADASNTSLSGISVAEGCPPSNVNDALRAMAGMLKRDWDKKGPTKTSAGTNTITLTLDTAPGGYVQGEVVSFVAGGTNTGAATLNVNGLGAKSITKNGTTALQGGEITAGAVATVMYDGTQFQLVSNNPREDAGIWGGTSSGSANAHTVSLAPAPGAYYSGMEVVFKAGFTNTGATTLNVNGLGAKNVFVANAACAGGEIVANQVYAGVYDGTQFQLVSPQGTQRGGLIGVQVFTTPGTATYTPTAGTNSVVVEVIGGGGGGGGAAATSASQAAIGSAGGGGGYSRKRLTTGFAGVSYTVGAKGVGGTAGNNDATAGSTSSFGPGPLLQATGGGAGTLGNAGTPPLIGASGTIPGVGSLGDINFRGFPGEIGIAMSTSSVIQPGGGGSLYGGSPAHITTATGLNGANANPANGYGSGGSAAANAASQAARGGGDATAGVVIVWEYN